VAGRIARNDALAEAVRSARTVSRTAFAPLIPQAMRGDPRAITALDDAVRIRERDGSLVRVKVWERNGTVIYSDDHSAIGKRYPLDADVAAAIDSQAHTADLSNLTDPENVTEVGRFHRLVEVYIPLNLDDGSHLAFEMYASDARVTAAENGLKAQLVPFALLALLILVVAQLPVSVWLVRRIGRAQNERSRLLNSALTASGRERKAIARDLHDGVVQDLAGACYAVDALQQRTAPDADARSHQLMDAVSRVLKEALGSLRTLTVAIYPPDLSTDGLQHAIGQMADQLRPSTEVTTTVDLDAQISPEAAAMVYRCVRECLANIAKHAGAAHANVTVSSDEATVLLEIRDDGVGLPPSGIDKRDEGHLGLRLLIDAAQDLGGEMRVSSGVDGGTTVWLELPNAAPSAHEQ